MSPRTNSPCLCNNFDEALDEGFYDPEVLLYCPRCGGRLPNLWKAYITDSERERLQKLLDSISTVDEAIQELGTPDHDGSFRVWDQIDGKLVYNARAAYFESLAPQTRYIEYYRVSKYANLEFYFLVGPGLETTKSHARIMLKLTDTVVNRKDLHFNVDDGTSSDNNEEIEDPPFESQ